jgi:hypothetical protein
LPHALTLRQGQRSVSRISAVSVSCCLGDFFNFAMSFDFGSCSLAQEMSFVAAICLISDNILSPTHYQPFCLSSLCLLNVCVEISSSTNLLLWCTQSTLPPFLHVLYSSLFIIQYFFFRAEVSLPRGYAGLSRGTCGNTACCLFVHLLVCISQAGVEPASGNAGALLFSQCNVAWRSFVWLEGSGCPI